VYRASDAKTLTWDIELPYNGTIDILEDKAEAINNFLQHEAGWVALTCNSPFITGFYITDYNKGVIGADHLY